MRVVIDTNVFISAGMREASRPASALRVAAQWHSMLKSSATEQELLITLDRPRLAPLISASFREWVERALAAAERVEVTERVVACRDPKDDKFLELGVNGGADLIVSGDADLLELHPFRGIPIVTPADFLHMVGR